MQKKTSAFSNKIRHKEEVVGLEPPVIHMSAYATGGLGRLYQQISNPNKVNFPAYDCGEFTDESGHFHPTLGCIIGSRYRVRDVLSRQGQSAVLLQAQDLFCQKRVVVVKVLHAGFYKLGAQETQCLWNLALADPDNNSNTVRLQNVFTFDDHFCMVFQPLVVGSLTEVFHDIPREKDKSLDDLFFLENVFDYDVSLVPSIRKVALRLLSTLGFLKQQNIIHADLKPENILLKNKGDLQSVTVIDFGNAIHHVHKEIALYYDDFELQTPLYRAPEVIFGLPFGTEIDMWSLGCILAELYLGKPLFFGTSKLDIIKEITALLGMFQTEIFQRGKFYNDLRQFTNSCKQPDTTEILLKKLGCKDYVFADFLGRLLRFDPDERLSIYEAACHPFLAPEVPVAFLLSLSSGNTSAYPRIKIPADRYSSKPEISPHIKRSQPSSYDLLSIGTSLKELQADDKKTGQQPTHQANVATVNPMQRKNRQNHNEVINDSDSDDSGPVFIQLRRTEEQSLSADVPALSRQQHNGLHVRDDHQLFSRGMGHIVDGTVNSSSLNNDPNKTSKDKSTNDSGGKTRTKLVRNRSSESRDRSMGKELHRNSNSAQNNRISLSESKNRHGGIVKRRSSGILISPRDKYSHTDTESNSAVATDSDNMSDVIPTFGSEDLCNEREQCRVTISERVENRQPNSNMWRKVDQEQKMKVENQPGHTTENSMFLVDSKSNEKEKSAAVKSSKHKTVDTKRTPTIENSNCKTKHKTTPQRDLKSIMDRIMQEQESVENDLLERHNYMELECENKTRFSEGKVRVESQKKSNDVDDQLTRNSRTSSGSDIKQKIHSYSSGLSDEDTRIQIDHCAQRMEEKRKKVLKGDRQSFTKQMMPDTKSNHLDDSFHFPHLSKTERRLEDESLPEASDSDQDVKSYETKTNGKHSSDVRAKPSCVTNENSNSQQEKQGEDNGGNLDLGSDYFNLNEHGSHSVITKDYQDWKSHDQKPDPVFDPNQSYAISSYNQPQGLIPNPDQRLHAVSNSKRSKSRKKLHFTNALVPRKKHLEDIRSRKSVQGKKTKGRKTTSENQHTEDVYVFNVEPDVDVPLHYKASQDKTCVSKLRRLSNNSTVEMHDKQHVAKSRSRTQSSDFKQTKSHTNNSRRRSIGATMIKKQTGEDRKKSIEEGTLPKFSVKPLPDTSAVMVMEEDVLFNCQKNSKHFEDHKVSNNSPVRVQDFLSHRNKLVTMGSRLKPQRSSLSTVSSTSSAEAREITPKLPRRKRNLLGIEDKGNIQTSVSDIDPDSSVKQSTFDFVRNSPVEPFQVKSDKLLNKDSQSEYIFMRNQKRKNLSSLSAEVTKRQKLSDVNTESLKNHRGDNKYDGPDGDGGKSCAEKSDLSNIDTTRISRSFTRQTVSLGNLAQKSPLAVKSPKYLTTLKSSILNKTSVLPSKFPIQKQNSFCLDVMSPVVKKFQSDKLESLRDSSPRDCDRRKHNSENTFTENGSEDSDSSEIDLIF